MFLSLTIICLVSSAVLASVNQWTQDPIETSKKDRLENSIKAVVPAFDNSPTEEAYMGGASEGDSLKIYPAKKGDELVGVAVESNSMKGFGGEISVLVGMTPSGDLINYEVLQHTETPGLGDKMASWFKTDKNKQNILGKKLSETVLKVSKDGGDVDAITAATISSRALLDAINRAYTAYTGYSDAGSGATEKTEETDGESGATGEEENPDTKIENQKGEHE